MQKLITYFLVCMILLCVSGAAAARQQELIGAGATFPYPLYSKTFDVYSKEYGVKVNYQAIGSGGGKAEALIKPISYNGKNILK